MEMKVVIFVFLFASSFSSPVKKSRTRIPLLDHLRAPLFAELDTSEVNKHLQNYITLEVEDRVNDKFQQNLEELVKREINKLKAELLEDNSKNIKNVRELAVSVINSSEQKWKSEMNDIKTRVMTLQNKTAEKTVLLHACITSTKRFSYTIIKLDNVKIHTGIDNIPNYTTSGKFTCQVPGLYLVSTSIMSNTGDAIYSIMKNKEKIFKSYLSREDGKYESVSGIVAVQLQVGDALWVNADNIVDVFEKSSCINIVKLR